MITTLQLNRLLTACYANLNAPTKPVIDNESDFISSLTLKLMKEAQSRPLPKDALLSTSSEAMSVFKDILLDASLQWQKKKEQNAQHVNLQAEITSYLNIENKSFNNYLSINDLIKKLMSSSSIKYSDVSNALREASMSREYFKKGLTPDSNENDVRQFDKFFSKLCIKLNTTLTNLQANAIVIDTGLLISLAKVSLALYSKQCHLEVTNNVGPVHIIHFYNRTHWSPDEIERPCSARSSEHLNTFDSDDEADEVISFDKTNHGLGSGVYGLGLLNESEIATAIDNLNANYRIFEIRNPLRLVDEQGSGEAVLGESARLTELSKYLQRACDGIKKQQYHLKCSRQDAVHAFLEKPENIDQLCVYASHLAKFNNLVRRHINAENIYMILTKSITSFYHAAKKGTSALVPMPINYVIKQLGFDGIVSSINDCFSRGLIAMEPVPDGIPLLLISIKPCVSNRASPTGVADVCDADEQREIPSLGFRPIR